MDLALSLYLADTSSHIFDRPGLARLFQVFGAHGLLAPRLKGSIKRGRSFAVRSGDELAGLAQRWPDGARVLLTTPAEDYEATVTLDDARCAIDIFFFAAFVASRTDSLLASVAAALRASMAETEAWCIKRNSGLSVRNFGYPRMRPARMPLVVDRGRLIDIVDLRVAALPEEQRAIAVIRDAPLPEGAAREVIGPKVLIEWAADCTLADDKAIRRRLAVREQWLIREAGSTPERDWNAAGDIKYGFIGGRPHPPLTLYSPALGVGYKAIHGAEPQTEIDATLQQVGRWIADQRVDDQTEVSDVIIIADSRASALALKPAMQKAGVRHVIYVGEDEKMWDPFPDGEWIED